MNKLDSDDSSKSSKINEIIDKLIKASNNNKELTLSADEVHVLRIEFEDTFVVPVLSVEEILNLHKTPK